MSISREGGGERSITPPPLVGRHSQMAISAEILERTRGGQGTVLMLAGGAGIGKTRLLQEIQRNALDLGFTCLQGRCRGDDPDPLVAIKELISQMPVLNDLRSRLTGPDPGWNAVKERLIHELLNLARSSPVLIALEDMQWADTSTLNLVHSLGRRTIGSNLLVIGTYRNEEVERQMNGEGSPLLDVTKALGKQGFLVEIFLDELADEDIKELVVRFLGSECDDEVYGAIIERSMGNPLFALENLKLMRQTKAIYEQGSHWHLDETRNMPSVPSMHAVVQSRLEQLPVEERVDLQVLSVLGQSFSLPLASDLLIRCSSANGPIGGRSPTLAMVWCDGSMMGFEHEEVRRAIYHSMPAERRKSVHHLTAVTLEGEGGTDVGHSILSYHFFNANDWKESMDHSMEAGREAWAQQANREAAGYFERALRSAENLGPEGREEHLLEIMESLGDLYASFCHFEACISCYEEARTIASDNETRARMLRKMSIPWASMGDFTDLSRPNQLLDQASRLEGVSEAEQIEIMSFRAAICFYQRDYEGAIQLCRRTKEWYERTGNIDDAFWEMVHISMYLHQLGRVDEAWGELERARSLITPETKIEAIREYYATRVELLMTFGHYQEAMATLETCMRKDDGSELYPNLSNDHWMMGLIWDLLGAHDRARESAVQAVKYAMIDEMRRAVVRSHALLAHENLMLGDIRAAEEALERISLLAEREGISSKAVGTGLFWLVMAEMHQVKGAEDLSEKELRNALSIIDKNEPDLLFSAIARLWFGMTMARIGDLQRSKVFLGEAAQRFRDLHNVDQARSIESIISDLSPGPS